jgi:hypothetical protein
MGTQIGNIKISNRNVYLAVNTKEMKEIAFEGFTTETYPNTSYGSTHICMTQEAFDNMVQDYIRYKLTGETPI